MHVGVWTQCTAFYAVSMTCVFTPLRGHMCGCMICWLMWCPVLFSTSIFSLRVCLKNLQKITKLLLELCRFSATARGVIRPAAAIAGSSDEPHRTRSCRESISERNGPFYLHHFAWSKPLFITNAAKAVIKKFWQQHWNNLSKVNKSLEGAEVTLQVFSVNNAARLSFHWYYVYFSHRGGLLHPTFCCCCIYIFLYVLSSFHAGPWITAHFEQIDIECQTFQALEKCIYPATCAPSVEVVVANVTVKGIWQGGSLMEATFDVSGIQIPPCQRILRPDELQLWLEWRSRCWRTAKCLLRYRKWPFCFHRVLPTCVSHCHSPRTAFSSFLVQINLWFNDQQWFTDKPENDSVIISSKNL